MAKIKRTPIRNMSNHELLTEYTSIARQAWDWRRQNPGANAGHSGLYQRELRMKNELERRLNKR